MAKRNRKEAHYKEDGGALALASMKTPTTAKPFQGSPCVGADMRSADLCEYVCVFERLPGLLRREPFFVR